MLTILRCLKIRPGSSSCSKTNTFERLRELNSDACKNNNWKLTWQIKVWLTKFTNRRLLSIFRISSNDSNSKLKNAWKSTKIDTNSFLITRVLRQKVSTIISSAVEIRLQNSKTALGNRNLYCQVARLYQCLLPLGKKILTWVVRNTLSCRRQVDFSAPMIL